LKFSWHGIKAHGPEFSENKLYGLIAAASSMIQKGEIDPELLTQILFIAKDIPRIQSNEPFSSKYQIFPEIEKITFSLGLILMDLIQMAKNSNTEMRIISCFNDILGKYLEILKNDDQDPKQLCCFILPGLFGFLRGFGRVKNGFQTYYPMEIGQRRLEGEAKRHEISHVGFMPSSNNQLESFNIPEETFGLIGDIFSFFHSGELDSSDSPLFDFITNRRDSSVYQTFSDYGVIYSGSLYAALYQLDSGSGKASHDQFRKQAKDSFKTYLEQISIFRKSLEVKSNDNQFDVSELQRKINCITCCIKGFSYFSLFLTALTKKK